LIEKIAHYDGAYDTVDIVIADYGYALVFFDGSFYAQSRLIGIFQIAG